MFRSSTGRSDVTAGSPVRIVAYRSITRTAIYTPLAGGLGGVTVHAAEPFAALASARTALKQFVEQSGSRSKLVCLLLE